ncbi:MAG: hypothetical protein E3J56_09840 [Candidatus Aminicenantes bacterium]|nr:MAG: hypothetical protein E3J56_09840 [Candidatus Aminicenantes bacterium]
MIFLMSSCQKNHDEVRPMTFKDELQFLSKYIEVLVLSDSIGSAKLITAPTWQGRVMTSTADGDNGFSFGWINHELIASGDVQEHINVYGGEDRLWLGPEGGQFSIFFKQGDPFDLDHWYVPKELDTESFEIIEKQQNRAVFQKHFNLRNYSNTEFKTELKREVKLLDEADIASQLGLEIPKNILKVAYTTVNSIKNSGNKSWTKDTGLLSIWILGMYNPSPETTVVIPFVEGDEKDLGPVVNDAYFGKVPESRLKIENGFVFFKGDGQYRSKIGLSPKRSKPILGSYDAGNHVLTIVTYTKPENVTDYVNSMWEIQEDPFAGDAVNSYNDGPPEPGAKPLGPFYELESSSPAAALSPGEILTHEHRTFHFQGSEADLDKIVRKCLGISLEKIKSALL